MGIDYRDLLRRYIQHIGACEGITYLTDHHINKDGSCVADVDIVFTPDEIAEMQKLDTEAL